MHLKTLFTREEASRAHRALIATEDWSMRIDGACHCGSITFEAEADPANTSICHCTDCQQLTGTAFRTSIRAEPGTFKILTGKPAIYVKTAESGNKRVQAFCGTCGSSIYATSPDGPEPKMYNIRLGLVRQRNELPPKVEIWCRSAQPWLGGLGTTRRFDKDRTP
jgi:hypothetical protein